MSKDTQPLLLESVSVNDEPGRFFVHLPSRKLGKWRWLGLLGLPLVLFAFGFYAGLFSFFAAAFRPLANNMQNNADWVFLAFASSFILFSLFGLRHLLRFIVSAVAVGLDRTSTSFTIEPEAISVVEHFLWVKYRRKQKPATSVQSISIDESVLAGTAEGFTIPGMDYSLNAVLRDGKAFPLAIGYPKSLLEALQTQVVGFCRREQIGNNIQAVANVVGDSANAAIEDRLGEGLNPIELDQPSESKIVVGRRPDGVTFEVPAAGLTRGSKGLFVFSLIWLAFSSIFVVSMVLSALGWIEQNGEGDLVSGFVIIGLFIMIGIAMLALSIHQGTRRATVATSHGMLMIASTSLFTKSRRQWDEGAIARIDVGPSGFEVNDVPMMQLQIHPTQGLKHGTLTSLSNEELLWMADELRKSLAIVETPPIKDIETAITKIETDTDGFPIPPAASALKVDRPDQGWTIDAPPVRTGYETLVFAVGCLFAGIGLAVPIYVLGFQGNRDLKAIGFFAVWSSMFVGAGASLAVATLLKAFTTFRISLEGQELSIDRIRPWGIRSFRRRLTSSTGVKAKLSSMQDPKQPKSYSLRLHDDSAPDVAFMSGHSPEDLAFVKRMIERSIPTEG